MIGSAFLIVIETLQSWQRALFEFVFQGGIHSSGDRLLRGLKWPGENRIAPAFALIYSNGNINPSSGEKAENKIYWMGSV